MKKLAEQHPFLTSIIVEVVFALCFILPGIIFKSILSNTDEYISGAIGEAVIALIALGGLILVGHQYVLKRFSVKSFFSGIFTGGFFVCQSFFSIFYLSFLALNWEALGAVTSSLIEVGYDFSGYAVMPASRIITFLLYMLLIGFTEEVVFRGIIAELLAKEMVKSAGKTRLCILFAGALFGIIHMVNAFETGIASGLVQTIAATMMGMVLVIMYLKNQNIWANIFIHALVDTASMFVVGAGVIGRSGELNDVTTGLTYSSVNLLSLIPYIIVLIVVMRKKNIETIIMKYNDELIADEDVAQEEAL